MERDTLRPTEDELMEREEKCRKAIRTVARAIFMRLFAAVLMFWALTRTELELWVLGLMAFVLLITVSGLLPLGTELKKRRQELRSILDQFE